MADDDAQHRLVQRQFGANAANYVTSPVHAKGKSLDRLVALTNPQPTWRCLDIATATGHTAFAFAPHVAHVTASDITPEMLDEARKVAASRELANVTFAAADAENLPFDDAAFDLVTCRIAPHHFPDCGRFVREAARVLKPGGTFALCDNIAPDAVTFPELPAPDTAAAAYNAFEKTRDPSHARALSAVEWAALAADAGLSILHSERLDKAMSFNRWCTTMSVAPDVKATLRGDLLKPESALASFVRPSPETADDDEAANHDISFTLTELVMIARRPGAATP
ncbi:MAG: methyltransferase domain-containing protein [Pseudomonadota bacterium]